MGEVVGEFVKQDITQTAAEDNAQYAPCQEVVKRFFSKNRIPLRDAALAQKAEKDKAEDVA